ncbi:MAG: hypothetical protein IJS96_07590 [Schwartzia sp.]|nr:hypothetical protein [Schwartzia sp. (in: firmicutes)]
MTKPEKNGDNKAIITTNSRTDSQLRERMDKLSSEIMKRNYTLYKRLESK